MIELHYAPIELDLMENDIEKLYFKNRHDEECFLKRVKNGIYIKLKQGFYKDAGIIYLLSFEDLAEIKETKINSRKGLSIKSVVKNEDLIFVFEDDKSINTFFEKFISTSKLINPSVKTKIFLFELSSFEEAYEMALDMREGTSDLVYNK